MYLTDGVRARLVGVMFFAPDGTHGPQPAGAATVWHYHEGENQCLGENGYPEMIEPVAPDGSALPCPVGARAARTDEMLHVWLPEVALDPASDDMDPDELGVDVDDLGTPAAPYLTTIYDRFGNLRSERVDAEPGWSISLA